MGTANFHQILADSPSKNDYLSRLTISPKQSTTLRTARDLVREAISDGFRNWKEILPPAELFTNSGKLDSQNVRLPKFKMQGSFAYKTLNLGAHVPPQEIDLDDGMFLPVTYEEITGNPSVLSEGLFRIAEQALKPLCDKKQWQLVSDKDTCVRIILNHGTDAHIDIALYAIEEHQYFELREELLRNTERALKTNDSLLFEDLYKSLPTDFVMLAHRKNGWLKSDPRKLEDWFSNAVNEHGYQLRNLCRYLKGWRDQKWENCSLSSIALMKVVVDAFQNQKHDFDAKRDDLALNSVLNDIPTLLRRRIENPVISGMYLDDSWTDEDREDFYTEAIRFQNQIRNVFNATSEAEVISQLQATLGNKIPNDPSLVEPNESSSPSSAIVTAPALIFGSENAHAENPNNPVKKSGGGRYA